MRRAVIISRHPKTFTEADLVLDKFAASQRLGGERAAKLNVAVSSTLVDVHPPTADAAVPKLTPAYLSAHLTNGRSSDTDAAANSCPKGTTAKRNLSCKTIQPMNRRGRHGLR
jgi:hypothetical protein